MDAIPLCVPFDRKDEARRAGARWQPDQRVWTCDRRLLASNAYRALRPFVPRRYQPDRAPPYLRPWMVPQTLWGRNLRALLNKAQWDDVRKHAYAQTGYRCMVCGEKGPEWPVEADEAWHYDDETRIQTLKAVIALCPDCHHVRHWGKSLIDGREEEVLAHMMAINGWTRAEAECIAEQALEQWEERSRHQWASDYSWVTRTHGFVVDEAGTARAEAANREVVAIARQRVEEAERLTLGVAPPSPIRPAFPSTTPHLEHKPRRSLLGTLKSLLR